MNSPRSPRSFASTSRVPFGYDPWGGRYVSAVRAALLGLIALLGATVASTGSAQTPIEPEPAAVEQPADPMQRLVDAFHTAMPRDPTQLRDPEVRRRVAKQAIPALRELERYLLDAAARGADAGDPAAADANQLATQRAESIARAAELAVYSHALGDPRYRPTIEEPANVAVSDASVTSPAAVDSGPGTASGTLAADAPQLTDSLRRHAAELIVAADDQERATALRALGATLRLLDEASPSAHAARGTVLAVLRAAALDAAELRELARDVREPIALQLLLDAAQRAAKDIIHRIGKPLVIEGPSHDGHTISTAAWRGKVVVIDFWATWCVPCVRALPQLAQLRERHAIDGLEILGVSCDRDSAALRDFIQAHPEFGWPSLFDPAKPGWHALATEFGIAAIPRVLLIDRKGVLRDADVHGERLAERVAELLREDG